MTFQPVLHSESTSHQGTSENFSSPRDEPLFDRHDLWFILQTQWTKLIAAPVTFLLVAIIWYLTATRLYESKTLLSIDPSFDRIVQVEQGTVEGQPSDLDSLLSLEIAVMEDSMVQRVVHLLNLREEPGFLPRKLAQKEDLADAELVDFLQSERFKANLIQGTRILQIRILDPSPERAQRIASAFASEVETFAAEQRRDEAESGRLALERQANLARKAALEAEDELRAFREKHPEFPMEQDHDLFATRLTQFGDQLNQITRERADLGSLHETLAAIDPNESPLEIIEVAEYDDMQHVSDLLTLRATSQVNLSNISQQYSEEHAAYRGAHDAYVTTDEQIKELAGNIKSAISAMFVAVQKKEATLEEEVRELKQQLVQMKTLSSEFRAMQQRVERQWLVHETIQTKLSESILATVLSSKIATQISKPLVAYQKAEPGALIPALVALILGSMVSLGWAGWCLVKGIPYTDQEQIEQRLGLPVAADLSREGTVIRPGRASMFLYSLGIQQARIIQILAPQLGAIGESVASVVAQATAAEGYRTLLLVITDESPPGTGEFVPHPSGSENLVRLEIPAYLAIHPSGLPAQIETIARDYDHLIIEAESADEPVLNRFLAELADKTVIVVGKGVTEKAAVTDCFELVSGSPTPPAFLMMDPLKPVSAHLIPFQGGPAPMTQAAAAC